MFDYHLFLRHVFERHSGLTQAYVMEKIINRLYIKVRFAVKILHSIWLFVRYICTYMMAKDYAE